MKYKKRFLQHEKWIMHSAIGEALADKLEVRPCPNFCPEEVQKVVDETIDKIYQMGFEDAVESIKMELMGIEYDEE